MLWFAALLGLLCMSVRQLLLRGAARDAETSKFVRPLLYTKTRESQLGFLAFARWKNVIRNAVDCNIKRVYLGDLHVLCMQNPRSGFDFFWESLPEDMKAPALI